MVPVTIDPSVSPVIGSYRLISRLASGGMGEVWLAEHQLLGRRAAIKVLLPQVSRVPEVVERFFAEARAATMISDPGIVHVYDFGWHGDDAYLAMELLEGEVLSARVARDGHLALPVALQLTHQVALTMASAHARGIVHRDLKPDNLFVVADAAVLGGERVKILDFGIAKLIGDDPHKPSHTRSGVLIGTPTYMSPEQCQGASDIDHRTDIYSLGCILYVLLAGRPPFVNELFGDMIVSHLMEEPEPPSTHGGGSPEIDDLVLRCLAKVRTDRFATMTELADALAVQIEASKESAPAGRRSGSTHDRVRPPPASVGLLPTLGREEVSVPVRTRGLGRWLIAALIGTSVMTAVILGARHSSKDQAPSSQGAPAPVDGQPFGAGIDSATVGTPPTIDAAAPPPVDAALDATPRDATPRDAEPRKRKDAAVGSGASYLDP